MSHEVGPDRAAKRYVGPAMIDAMDGWRETDWRPQRPVYGKKTAVLTVIVGGLMYGVPAYLLHDAYVGLARLL